MRMKPLLVGMISVLAFNVAFAAPKDDLDKLRSFQYVMSDFSKDVSELTKRFVATRDARSAELSNNLANGILLVTLSLESLKDTVVAIGILKCDKASQEYFKDVAKIRFGETGVQATLDQQISDISTWISFTDNARLIAQATRLRDTLRSIKQELAAMRPRYA